MFGFIMGVTIMVIDYPAISGQTGCSPPNCYKVTITASYFTSVHNNTHITTGHAAWVTDGVASGQCASVSSIYPAWEAQLGQNRTVSRIKIFWEAEQDDVYVSVGGRICHSAVSTASTYRWTPEYTLVCGVPVMGNSLRIYRQPTLGLLNLSLCEVEIYATSESSAPASTTTHGPPTRPIAVGVTPRTLPSSDVLANAANSISLTTATTTSSASTTPSFIFKSTSHASPTTTISLTTAATTSSTPTTSPSTAASTSSTPTTLSSTAATTSSTPTTSSSTAASTSSTRTTLSSTAATTSSTPTTSSSTAASTSSTPTTLSSTATTTSSTPTTPSANDTSASSVNTTTTTLFLETSAPVMPSYETIQTEATTFPTFTIPEELHDSTSNHFLASSPTVPPDTSNPTNTHTYFTWPTSSWLPSQGSSSMFRSTPVNLSFHSLTDSDASMPYLTLQNRSMIQSTYKLTPTTTMPAVSATSTTANSVSETNVHVQATFTRSVNSTPTSTTITATTTLTSNGGSLTTPANPDAAGTTPNVGKEPSTEKAKTSNMNLVVIVAVSGGCVMLLYIVGITVFVWRQHRKARYSPGRAK